MNYLLCLSLSVKMALVVKILEQRVLRQPFRNMNPVFIQDEAGAVDEG